MITIHPIPMSVDNYGWLLIQRLADSSQPPPAIVIDPTQAGPVQRVLNDHQASLTAIWATHHHSDHVGGIAQLLPWGPPGMDVLGSAYDVAHGRIPCATHGLTHNAPFTSGQVDGVAMYVPGHTIGALAYYVPAAQAVFVGDTLFAAGCGRLFEGDAAMMWGSLARLRALPNETNVYCGHEYTVKNLKFALTLEPQSAPLQKALAKAQSERDMHRPTVPTSIAQEKRLNPFLRADDPQLWQALACTSPESALAELRRRRDTFNG
jgi:hydroxyacylglutathione hydrolase